MSLAFESELAGELFSAALVVETLALPLLPARSQSSFAVGKSDMGLLEGFCGSAKITLEFLNIRMRCCLPHMKFGQYAPVTDMA